MAKYPTISVCMIVKNEEANLPRLLTSIEGLADEIIIVDTGSTDRTVEIAGGSGAKVHRFTWCDDFSAARNESLAHATMDYVLWLDGDDEVEKNEHEKIKTHLRQHRGTAIYLRLRNTHPGEETEAVQLRMFPNHKGVRFAGRVHEQVFFSVQEKGIRTTTCDGAIIHHGYEDRGTVEDKFRRNIRIHEQELIEDPDNPLPRFFLARALKGLGQLENALKSYLDFISRAKNRPEIVVLDVYKIALLEAGEMYCNLERLIDGISLLEESRNLFPEFRLFSMSLGQLYFQEKDYGRAYETLKPLRGYPFDAECVPIEVKKLQLILHRYLGTSAMFAGDHATATECLSECVRMEPRNGEHYNYLALAYERSGNPEKVIETCDRGLATCPDDGLLKKKRFLALVKNGDIETALSCFEALNGQSRDTDTVSAMFTVYCMKLDAAGMTRYYQLLQESVYLAAQPFPEGLERVRKALATANESQAVELFDSGISHLLKISA